MNNNSENVCRDVQDILGIKDPDACWFVDEGSFELVVSIAVKGSAFKMFHRMLVRSHKVRRYALHWELGASVLPNTGDPFGDDAGSFPPYFRVLVHRRSNADEDNDWMRWLSAPASVSLGVVYSVDDGPLSTTNTSAAIEWSRNWNLRAPHLELYIAGVQQPNLCKLIDVLHGSRSNVKSVFVKLTRIPSVGDRILEALRVRERMGSKSLRPCRLWLCVPNGLTDAERTTIWMKVNRLFTRFQWVDCLSSDAPPPVDFVVGAPCTTLFENLPDDVIQNIMSFVDTDASAAAMARVSRRTREKIHPYPLLCVELKAWEVGMYENPRRVKHLRVGPTANGWSHPLATAAIGEPFESLRSIWLEGVRYGPSVVDVRRADKEKRTLTVHSRPLHRSPLRHFFWDTSIVTPDGAAVGLRAHPAERVSLILTLVVKSVHGDHRECEILFSAIESLSDCKWLSLSLVLSSYDGTIKRQQLDWTRVRPIKWPSTLRRLEIRNLWDGAVVLHGNFVPFVRSVHPSVDYLQIDISIRSVLMSAEEGDGKLWEESNTQRTDFCVELTGYKHRDDVTDRMATLLLSGSAARSRVVVDYIDKQEYDIYSVVPYYIFRILQDAKVYALRIQSRLELEVLVAYASDAYYLANDLESACNGTIQDIYTKISFVENDSMTTNNKVFRFPIVGPLEHDWAREGPIGSSAYRPSQG